MSENDATMSIGDLAIGETEERLHTLKDSKVTMVDYLLLKAKEEDWHGVADAANDLREIDVCIAELSDLREMLAAYRPGCERCGA